jgi:hypothetical protein
MNTAHKRNGSVQPGSANDGMRVRNQHTLQTQFVLRITGCSQHRATIVLCKRNVTFFVSPTVTWNTPALGRVHVHVHVALGEICMYFSDVYT